MSAMLTVYNAVTGATATASPDRFVSVDDLKAWIAETHGVDAGSQLLLTQRGATQLKLEAISYGQVVFVFDRSLIGAAANATDEALDKAAGETEAVAKPPGPVAGTGAMVNVSQTFLVRAQWAAKALDQARRAGETLEQLRKREDVVRQGMDVATRHMLQHNAALERSLGTRADMAAALARDTRASLEWRRAYDASAKISVHESLGGGALSEWVNVGEVRAAADKCAKLGVAIDRDLKSIRERVGDVVKAGRQLEANVLATTTPSGATIATATANAATDEYKDIIDDIEAITTKIQSDTDYVGTLDDTPASAKVCQRMQARHEREFLPPIETSLRELGGLVAAQRQQLRATQVELLRLLKEIAQVQYRASVLRPDLAQLQKSIDSAEDARVTVAKALDLPYLYGVMLVELCRRALWTAETRALAADAAEGMAARRHDEESRRQKWHKHYGDIDVFRRIRSHDPADVEVAYKAPRQPPPEISKSDVTAYIGNLEILGLEQERVELQREFQGMVMAASQAGTGAAAAKRAVSAGATISPVSSDSGSGSGGGSVQASLGLFKNGSVVKTDQTEKIRSYESRIRRLEDLLIQYRYREMNSGAGRPPSISGPSAVPGASASTPGPGPGAGPGAGPTVQSSGPGPSSTTAVATPGAPPTPDSLSETQTNTEAQQLKRQIESLEKQHARDAEQIEAYSKRAAETETQMASDKARVRELEATVADLTAKLEQSDAKRADAESLKKELLANLAAKESEYASFMSTQKRESETRIEALQDEVDTLESRVDELNEALETRADVMLALEDERSTYKAKYDRLYVRSRDLSQRLYTGYRRSCEILESMGLQASKEINGTSVAFKVNRVKGLGRRSSSQNAARSGDLLREASALLDESGAKQPSISDPAVLYWMDRDDAEAEEDAFCRFTNEVYIDYDVFRDAVSKRFGDIEHLARKLQRETRQYRERTHRAEDEVRRRLALHSFKEGDLVLFLPTRDPTRDPNPWAAFNVGAPHYFLNQKDDHQLANREYLLARITRIEERVVNKATDSPADNPFDLSDGLRWHLLDATPQW